MDWDLSDHSSYIVTLVFILSARMKVRGRSYHIRSEVFWNAFFMVKPGWSKIDL